MCRVRTEVCGEYLAMSRWREQKASQIENETESTTREYFQNKASLASVLVPVIDHAVHFGFMNLQLLNDLPFRFSIIKHLRDYEHLMLLGRRERLLVT